MALREGHCAGARATYGRCVKAAVPAPTPALCSRGSIGYRTRRPLPPGGLDLRKLIPIDPELALARTAPAEAVAELTRICQVLDVLSVEVRLVLLLRRVEGYSWPEIASLLGCSLPRSSDGSSEPNARSRPTSRESDEPARRAVGVLSRQRAARAQPPGAASARARRRIARRARRVRSDRDRSRDAGAGRAAHDARSRTLCRQAQPRA